MPLSVLAKAQRAGIVIENKNDISDYPRRGEIDNGQLGHERLG